LAYRGIGYADTDFLALQVLCQALRKRLAAAASKLEAARIELRLRALRRDSIVEILVSPRPPKPPDATTTCRAVDEIVAGAPVLDSELCQALRRVLLETCVARDDQDELARQVLHVGLSRNGVGAEENAQETVGASRESIDKVRAGTFRNPIVVSSY
jgi:hypothetical protein